MQRVLCLERGFRATGYGGMVKPNPCFYIFLLPLIVFSLCKHVLSDLFTKRAKRRCAERGKTSQLLSCSSDFISRQAKVIELYPRLAARNL